MTASITADATPTGAARVLAAVFAHPDDETFSMGGTLARYAAGGVACHILCATDGEAGSSSDVIVNSREELGRVRRAELEAAAQILGVCSTQTLGHPDGGLAQVDADLLVEEVVRFLRLRRPRVVVTFGPEGAPNAHRDHRAISRAATAAFFLSGLPTAFPGQLEERLEPFTPDRLYYCSWEPDPALSGSAIQAVPRTARVTMKEWGAAKRAAFRAHRTQQTSAVHFAPEAYREAESFALAAGLPQPAYMIADLFDGL